VAVERAVRGAGRIQKYREVGDTDPGIGRNQVDEGKLIHEVMQEFAVFDQLRLGDVKGFGRWWLLRVQFESCESPANQL
jgi:hypothetical protein